MEEPESREGGRLEVIALYALSATAAFIAGLALSFNRGPETASYMVAGGLIAYLVASIVVYKARWVPLALTLGLHVGAILSYYSNPLVLPLLVVERWGERAALNIDIVQLALAYELATVTLARLRQNFKNLASKPIQPREPR